ncbi:hypothetical protein ACX801_13570 [Arthrobacter bambusae]|uniref:hypothetical protein n=1 Tax=Arthrobacter sp. NPDC058127 TaxID=3346351 RepID=UPI0036F011E6
MKTEALLASVARFRPFIDGNRGTAWTLMVQLLWSNRHRHDFNPDEGFALVVGVAADDIDLQGSAVLIEQHLIRR